MDFQSDEVAPTLPAFIDRLYAVAQNASNVVIGLLTDESPEGHLPDDDLDDGGALCLDSDVLAQKSKLVMGHAWCTMREISRLLTTLLERLDDTTQTAVSIPRGTLLSMGAFLHTLLTTVRHVGAYWAVAAVFGVFCNKLMASNDVNVRSLLARWLVDLLRSVDNLSSLLSITRRSGGLPFAITAILLAESNVKLRSQSLLTLDAAVAMGGGVLEDDQSSATVFPPPLSYPSRPLLSVTMDHLFDIAQRPLSQSDIAENKTDLQQVHAFNILRAVFQDNHLGPEAQRWVVGGVELAILGFNSPW